MRAQSVRKYTYICLYIYVYVYDGFLKWGYPQMDGLEWKILFKWMINGGTHMTYLGNLHDLLNGDFPVRKLSND